MSKYDIAANIALAQMDGFYGKLTAAQQRELFGKNIFGRKTVAIDASGQGTVTASWSVCFGTDSVWNEVSFEEIAADVNGIKPVRFF